MTIPSSFLSVAAAFAVFAAAPAQTAEAAVSKKPAPGKVTKKAPAKPVAEAPPPAADADQVDAAGRVFYGAYDCEFKQTIDIAASPKYPSYVELKHGKAEYLMKPVLSSTGAIRLEDVRGETLMVQIASKSMLLNVKTAHRLVDDCVSPKQRELIEAGRAQKAAQVAAASTGSATPALLSTPVAEATGPLPASAAATLTTALPAQAK